MRALRTSSVFVFFIPIVLAAALPFSASAQAGRTQAANAQATPPGILLGNAWYPEQWPESRWEADLQLMEAAGMKFVRVGEFAWSAMEPQEGQFDFGWLERAIDAAAKHHIQVVLGTPTAAPPAWLTRKYPDTLRVDQNGRRAEHGNRQQFSFTSPRYREFARRIATEMAKRFGHNPNVIGWQIDNEYADVSFDDVTKHDWQQWLQRKYRTLDNLNQRWTTAYWSQTYDAWDEIPIEVDYGNPGLLLDWKRFVSDVWRDYQRNQLEAIRANSDARQFITTNFMGWFQGFDQYIVGQDLTFIAWDDYVGARHLDPFGNGLLHDLERGIKRQNIWLMETQPGAVNWAPVNVFLNKGEVRAMAWNGVGHGVDAVSYWQWRSALNGQEQYHGTLVGADGTPVPLYNEVKQLGAEFAKVSPALTGTTPKSQVALLHSYESRWAIDFQKHNRSYDQLSVLRNFYRSFYEIAQSVDVVNPYAPLNEYKLVVAPDLNLIPDDLAQRLRQYVKAGGHLVLGPRAGMKDQFNALNPQRQPGALAPDLGGRVEQYYALDKAVPLSGEVGSGTGETWAEQLGANSPETQPLLTYGTSNGWLDGQPAILTRQLGKGRITYIGTLADEKLMDAIAQWATRDSGVTPAFGAVPAGVDVTRRVSPDHDIFIVINFGTTAQRVHLPSPMRDLLGGGAQVNDVNLERYGVAVLESAHRQ